MINATDLKNGTTFLLNHEPHKVLKYTLIKMGRGGAIVRVNARNLITGTTEDKTFSSNVKVEDVSLSKKNLQFLFSDANVVTFMDSVTFEQIEIPTSVVKEELSFVKEGETVSILFWDDRALSIDIPPKVNLKVSETDPGAKGNSTSNVYKPAKLENGMMVKVPLFIKIGDMIRVDTRTGDYVERSK